MVKKMDIGCRRGIVHDDEVALPSIFKKGKLYNFKVKELQLFHALMENGGDLGAACQYLECDISKAQAVLRKKEVRKFLEEIAEEYAIKQGITAPWCAKELFDVWTGKKEVSKVQMEAMKELMARTWPKVERIQHDFQEGDFCFVAKGQASKII